jgi:hypothetical protein
MHDCYRYATTFLSTCLKKRRFGFKEAAAFMSAPDIAKTKPANKLASTDAANDADKKRKAIDGKHDIHLPDEDDGLIRTGRKMYRAPLPSLYKDPKIQEDLPDGCDWPYRKGGKALQQHTSPLLPRDDVILFTDKPEQYQKELNKNLKLGDCPPDQHQPILEMVKEYWDCFTEDGLALPIWGIKFVVDTGDSAPKACKIPRYGPHEGKVIMDLVNAMEENGIVEQCSGPWASLLVLAPKANQETNPWYEYIWRLCVSYRRVNQWTRPHTRTPFQDVTTHWMTSRQRWDSLPHST